MLASIYGVTAIPTTGMGMELPRIGSPCAHLLEPKAPQQPLIHVIHHRRCLEQYVHARRLITRIEHEKPEPIDMVL